MAAGGTPDAYARPVSTAPYGSEPSRRVDLPLLLALVAALVTLALVVVLALRWMGGGDDFDGAGPGSDPTTSGPAPAPSPADPPSTPTQSPRPWPTTAREPAHLPAPSRAPRNNSSPASPTRGAKTNSLYALDLPTGQGWCRLPVRAPKPPLRDSQLAPYLDKVVKCLSTALQGPLARSGFRLATPSVNAYRGSVRTPCGRLSSKASPAYYCPATATIYWPVTGDDGREAYTFARLGYVALTAHEFGHHVQAATGILTDYSRAYYRATDRQRYALTRRLELQAQCFEGVFLSYLSAAINLTGQDRYELEQWHSFTGDEDPPTGRRPDHGSSRAQIAWLNRGLAGSDFGRCNTWTAPASRVR